jgi:hypothetical protein
MLQEEMNDYLRQTTFSHPKTFSLKPLQPFMSLQQKGEIHLEVPHGQAPSRWALSTLTPPVLLAL